MSQKNIKGVPLSFGRKYYKFQLENGFICKLISKDKLEIDKEVDLLCEDLSIRSKYGVDVIYEVVSENKTGEIVLLKCDSYNEYLVKTCKKLGGKWDPEAKCWAFNSIVSDKVEELDELFNSEIINVEITAVDTIEYRCRPVDFCGYGICKASGRDSGAKLFEGISLISGSCSSNGLRANWNTYIRTGSVFRLQVAKNVLEAYREGEEKYFSVKILGE